MARPGSSAPRLNIERGSKAELEGHANEIRAALRAIRHHVESGGIESVPLARITSLIEHSTRLSELLDSVIVFSPRGEERLFEHLDDVVHARPEVLLHPLDESSMYLGLGFSPQEYRDLTIWRTALAQNEYGGLLLLDRAFRHFVNVVLQEIEERKHALTWDDFLGLASPVPIAADVLIFMRTPAPVSDNAVMSLIVSTVTGVLALAKTLPQVRKKLIDKGQPLTR